MAPTHFQDPHGALVNAQRIMLVDDTPDNLSLLKNMLGYLGFDIFAFPSGPLALRAAELNPPDLVLLDISMPEMDGYEVCRRFKHNPALADVPIIFLTAMSETADKVRGFKLGAVDFITKPFQFEEVHARVNAHLELRALRKRLEYQNRHLQDLVDEKVKELAEAHKEARRRLAEIAHMNRNITSSVFSTAIAHDLRQPLTAILSNAEAGELFLAQQPPALEEIKAILGDIRRDTLRASQIIQRMRSMLNKTQTEIEEIDINQILIDVASFLDGEARVREIAITSSLAPHPLKVLGDRIQLQQVMINLVLNGMDAMADTPPARRTIHVTAKEAPNHQAEVVVSDAGIGFAHLDHAFESFFTTKPQGMGMGLSITAALIHAHGGQIWAENKPEGGANVYFRLPLDNYSR